MTDQLPVPPSDSEVQGIPPPHFWPVVTLIILAFNLVCFILMSFAGGSANAKVLLEFGASYGPFLHRGEYWRLVMPMFLHIGLHHLLVNSLALLFLCPILERVYGYGRFATLYVATGVGGALLSMMASPHVAAGASGAIFGVAGALVVTSYVHRDMIPQRWGGTFRRGVILVFILADVALGFTQRGIDNWAHLGGLATGVLLALVMPPPGHDLAPGETAEPTSQAIVVLPLATVLLAATATVNHYRTAQAVRAMLIEGARYEAAHQFDRALQLFEDASRRDPLDERPHDQLGTLYLAQRNYDQAIREFEEAVRLGIPDDPESHLRLGLAYRLKGDLAKAQQNFEAALGKDPQTADAQMLLADLYAEQKLYADAIAHYQQALQFEANLAVAHNNLAWLYATSEDPKYRDSQAALDHAQRAVELTRWKVAGFIDTLAEAHFAHGDYEQAVDIQRQALALDPDNQELQEHMSRYLKAAAN